VCTPAALFAPFTIGDILKLASAQILSFTGAAQWTPLEHLFSHPFVFVCTPAAPFVKLTIGNIVVVAKGLVCATTCAGLRTSELRAFVAAHSSATLPLLSWVAAAEHFHVFAIGHVFAHEAFTLSNQLCQGGAPPPCDGRGATNATPALRSALSYSLVCAQALRVQCCLTSLFVNPFPVSASVPLHPPMPAASFAYAIIVPRIAA
jgi:hypothetical protein